MYIFFWVHKRMLKADGRIGSACGSWKSSPSKGWEIAERTRGRRRLRTETVRATIVSKLIKLGHERSDVFQSTYIYNVFASEQISKYMPLLWIKITQIFVLREDPYTDWSRGNKGLIPLYLTRGLGLALRRIQARWYKTTSVLSSLKIRPSHITDILLIKTL